MKSVITSALFTLLASHAIASTIKLECGRTFNIPRTVVIKEKNPGQDGYTHSATFKTSGKDQTTGMLKAVTYKMVGQFDLSTEFSGKEEPVLALVDSKDPLFQLVIKKPTSNKSAPIPAIQINLRDESMTPFDCFLK